jgi:acyl carrier protein
MAPLVAELRALPRSERREALESFVVEQFKVTLLMPEDEELPPDESLFDLGFTSLRVIEAKNRIEAAIGQAVSANVLFNSPTVAALIDHLATTALADVLAAPTPVTPPRRTLWDNVTEVAYDR